LIDQSNLTVEAQTGPISQTSLARHDFPVALVSMPFVSYHRPSIQLGLLKAIAAAYNFPVTTFHFNLDFAQQIGTETYDLLCEFRGHLLGDWLFSRAAFGEAAPPDEDFLTLEKLHLDKNIAALVEDKERIQNLRLKEIPAYIERLVAAVEWDKFKVIGFTSTFQQNTASFALATAIKRRYPQIKTVFGGANFEDEMGLELTRTIDCIDYAIIGEGDKAFPEFLIALQEGRDPAEVRGVVTRRDGRVTPLSSNPPFRSLDELPTPDYTEYFERARALKLLPEDPEECVLIPFESSRGCWWGQKHQCTFCGLNGTGITYRAKSPQRMMAELEELSKFYPSTVMEAVDNILNMSYFTTVFQELSQAEPGYKLFYEVKANLSKEQLKLLHQGGVISIQPGIESLNSHVLKLMRKGISAIQNVNTMRWARHYNVDVGWNMLWGFPGETEEDYRQQATLIPLLTHLSPPSGYGRIWMERFSPIYFEKELFPTSYRKPEASYGYIYPEKVDLEKIAYFFDYEFENTLPEVTYKDLAQQLKSWREAWEKPEKPLLLYWTYEGFIQIEDLRWPDQPRTYNVVEPQASIYLALSDQPHTALSIKSKYNLPMPVSEIEKYLQKFCDMGLMMRDGNYYLSLAIPSNRPRYTIKDGRICLNLSLEETPVAQPELADAVV
jgi:ribosomal peptide maturation radical SAM protein 1